LSDLTNNYSFVWAYLALNLPVTSRRHDRSGGIWTL